MWPKLKAQFNFKYVICRNFKYATCRNFRPTLLRIRLLYIYIYIYDDDDDYIITWHVPFSKMIGSVFISDSINFVLKVLLINDTPWDCFCMWFYEANQYAGWKSSSKLFCLGSPFYHGHHWTGSLALRSPYWKYAKLSSGSWSEVQFFTMVVVSFSWKSTWEGYSIYSACSMLVDMSNIFFLFWALFWLYFFQEMSWWTRLRN
jgi:hypothetical protein